MGRVGGAIRHDHHLRRPCRHVDGHAIEDLELGLGHPRGTGPHDLVDGPDRRGAIRERGDRLRAAHDVQFVDPHEPRSAERHRCDDAIPRGGGGHDQLPDAGEARRDGAHQQRRGEGRAAARHIAAHPLEAPPEAADADARRDVDPLLRERHLGRMEALDVGGHGLEGLAQVAGEEVTRGEQLLARDPQPRRPPVRRRQPAAVSGIEVPEGHVPLVANPRHDRPDALPQLGRGGGRAPEDGVTPGLVEVRESHPSERGGDDDGGVGRAGHGSSFSTGTTRIPLAPAARSRDRIACT